MLGGGILGVIIALAIARALSQRAPAPSAGDERRRAIAELLDGGVVGPQGVVAGGYGGARVKIELGTRGTTSRTLPWTQIDVDLPRGYPVTIALRPRRARDVRAIERGELAPVALGDATLDDELVLEAAPVEIVRALFDEETRAFLRRLAEVELTTIHHGSRSVLRLGVPRWADAAQAEELVGALVDLAGRLRAAHAAADAAIEPAVGGAPFRPDVDDEPVRAARAARAAEVERVDAMRVFREQRAVRVALVVGIAAIGAGLVIALAAR
jgi:hypothetical protein